MDYDYRKRDYLLPPGCNDLIDVIAGHSNVAEIPPYNISEYQGSLVATLELPEKAIGNIEIFVEGQKIRIVVPKWPDFHALCERVIEVPAGYNPAVARAFYRKGILRILIPKC